LAWARHPNAERKVTDFAFHVSHLITHAVEGDQKAVRSSIAVPVPRR
jgi:hypothetical protein